MTKHISRHLAIVFILCSASLLHAQESRQPSATIKKIEVVGSAELEVVPDEVFVNVTLQEYNKGSKKITIDEVSKDFLEICSNAGIDKNRIQIENMSGYDQTSWWWRRRKKEQPDLVQSTTYIIKFTSPSDIDKMANMLDDKATQNIYISKTSNSKQNEYRKQLKVQALQNAKAKAQYLLEGIGSKVGAVLYVKEIEVQNSNHYMYERNMLANSSMQADGRSNANEGMDFKFIKYRYEVEAHFEIQ